MGSKITTKQSRGVTVTHETRQTICHCVGGFFRVKREMKNSALVCHYLMDTDTEGIISLLLFMANA